MKWFKPLVSPKSREKVFEPERPRAAADAHPVINLDSTEFLMPEEVMAANVTVEELGVLLTATEACLRQTLRQSPADFSLRVRYTVYKDRPVGIDLGLDHPLEDADLSKTLQQVYEALNQLEPLSMTAKVHPVVLCAYFRVNKTY